MQMLNRLVKNIIISLGIFFCLIVLVLNVIYISKIGNTIEENVSIENISISNMIITVLLVIVLKVLIRETEKLSSNTKWVIFVTFIVIYIIAQVCWINIRKATPSGDQGEVFSAAVKMYENKLNELNGSKYFEMCPQQITIFAVFGTIFRLLSNSNVKVLQYANVISNVLTIIAIIMIDKKVDKYYNINKTRIIIFSGTFLSLPLLSTFVYGDLISLPFCLFALYFIMQYVIEKKNKYAIISATLMAIGYMLRMNNLIFIMAIVIYLILNIIDEKECIFSKIIVLVLFIILTLLPATLIRNSLQHKLNLNKNKQLPTTGYLYIGMQESYRANGWYSDYASWAWEDVETSNERYTRAIKERVKYFLQNPGYFVKFYIKKVASMWTENTYASLWYNQTFNFKKIENQENLITSQKIDELVRNNTENILIYQKALILMIFGTTIIVIIKNRKKLSNETILLITIFIGGFLFHILWEAKSRYIIPYILVLIPIASIDNWKRENNEK